MSMCLMHVHDCQCMSSECDGEHSMSYDTKSTPMHFTATANQVSRSSLVGRSRRTLCLCCRHRRATFSFSADARSVS